MLLGSSLAYQSGALASISSVNKSIIKVGLIGCGGRGTGAAVQAMKADPNVEITAMGDVFEDRLEEAYGALKKVSAGQVKVDEKRKFIGFDAYQKVLDSGVDVVLLTTPPAFRPGHFTAAVNAGKHVFCEKPVAVDAPGVRQVLAAAELAKQKNLSVVSGFCFRYDLPSRALFEKVKQGSVGEIRSISSFRFGGELWYFDRQPDWSQMTYDMRNWYYKNWLSGDFIVEQTVHSLDMMSWAMGDVMPVNAIGSGGRQARTDEKYGNIYDHFSIEYQYENGAKGYHFARQQSATTSKNTVDIMGSDGYASVHVGRKYEIKGKENWLYSDKKNNMYQTQHDELFASIRSGKSIHDGKIMTNSTLLAIWGRMVAYTGLSLTLEQVLNSTEQLGPNLDEYNWDLDWQTNPIAIPGRTKFH